MDQEQDTNLFALYTLEKSEVKSKKMKCRLFVGVKGLWVSLLYFISMS